jgi:hypothetical protein
VNRLALPLGRRQLPRLTKRVQSLGGIAIASRPLVPIPGTKWDFGYGYAGVDAVEIWTGPWILDDQVRLEHCHAMLLPARSSPRSAAPTATAPVRRTARPRLWSAPAHCPRPRSCAASPPATAGSRSRHQSRPHLRGDPRQPHGLVRRAARGRPHRPGRRSPRGRGAPNCLAQIMGPTVPLAGGVTAGAATRVTGS